MIAVMPWYKEWFLPLRQLPRRPYERDSKRLILIGFKPA
jgi:hypothetical protein